MAKLSRLLGLLGACVIAASIATTAQAEGIAVNYPSGTYTASQLVVKLSGDDLRYSLDGEQYKTYKRGIKIKQNASLYVRAADGETECYTYALKPKVTIDYDDNAGRVSVAAEDDVTVYCSVNGAGVFEYKEPFVLEKDATVKFSVLKNGCTPYVVERKFIVSAYKPLTERYEQKFYYKQCTAKQRVLYSMFYDMVSSRKGATTTHNVAKGTTLDDVQLAYWAFEMDNGHFPWSAHSVGYAFDKETGELCMAEPLYKDVDDKALSKLYNKIAGLTAYADGFQTDKEKMKFFHDVIIDGCEYSTDGAYTTTAEGALIYGKAQCIGYSKAFMWLCQESGIPCICVSNEVHQWNMVYLDGEWYHIDVTHDDPVAAKPMHLYKYFLVDNAAMTAMRDVTNKGLRLPE